MDKLPSIFELISLAGRQAVITGGAQGLGLAIGRRLAEAGASIIIGDINEPLAVTALGELAPPAVASHYAYKVDVRSGESVAHFANSIGKAGGVDIWINAAGIFPTQPFLSISEEHWDAMMNVNLRGTFLCGRAAADLMIPTQKKKGVIVNISSTSGHRGRQTLAHYSASKLIRPIVPIKAGGTRSLANLKLLHSTCQRQFRIANGRDTEVPAP